MPRTKGSKNRVTASTDFDAQIAYVVTNLPIFFSFHTSNFRP